MMESSRVPAGALAPPAIRGSDIGVRLAVGLAPGFI